MHVQMYIHTNVCMQIHKSLVMQLDIILFSRRGSHMISVEKGPYSQGGNYGVDNNGMGGYAPSPYAGGGGVDDQSSFGPESPFYNPFPSSQQQRRIIPSSSSSSHPQLPGSVKRKKEVSHSSPN